MICAECHAGLSDGQEYIAIWENEMIQMWCEKCRPPSILTRYYEDPVAAAIHKQTEEFTKQYRADNEKLNADDLVIRDVVMKLTRAQEAHTEAIRAQTAMQREAEAIKLEMELRGIPEPENTAGNRSQALRYNEECAWMQQIRGRINAFRGGAKDECMPIDTPNAGRAGAKDEGKETWTCPKCHLENSVIVAFCGRCAHS